LLAPILNIRLSCFPQSEAKADVDEDEKVRIRREKKRESVRRSRKRQRDYVLQIEGENQRLKDELKKLRSKVERIDKPEAPQSMGFQNLPRHIAMVTAPMTSASRDSGSIAPKGV
jgi:hypothetical protein